MSAQTKSNWTLNGKNKTSKSALDLTKKNSISTYQSFTLDFETMKEELMVLGRPRHGKMISNTTAIDFPTETGSLETFNIEKANVLDPALAAKYPEIQSYYGVSTTNPLNKIYISVSPAGFTGVITGKNTIYIDPSNDTTTTNYIVYNRANSTKNANDGFICNTADTEITTNKSTVTGKTTSSTDGKSRIYRIAIACTSEYSSYYGNTVAKVLAAMNTTITRVNSVYKRDLNIQFQIVADNDKLIFINGTNPSATSPITEPYDNYDGTGMLNVNTSTISSIIGVNAYDIGHVFSTGGGGIASTAPCSSTNKGKGVTGIVTPQFDPFDIDYVCHEIGHQFGAGHTYYNACFGSKVTDDYETGSASTIMGYAGICAPNVQSNSDAYFHVRSIEQMTTAIAGHTCVTGTTVTNSAPVAVAGGNYSIPKNTPFILDGSGSTDANSSDVLTYCWEQYDNDGSYTQPPVNSNAGGPIFRSFLPVADPTRTFPNLNAVINNETPTWEVLPNVARTLNFKLTVRDNNTSGGRTSIASNTITVGNVGPFSVSYPTATDTWYVGDSKTITWNNTGTNTATYALNVAIKLSTDGGFTYPITLLASTPNDGSQSIVVPNAIGTNNRIKVEAVGNIFFDISDANFTIKANTFELTASSNKASSCKPANTSYSLNYTPAPGFTQTTTFSASGLPSGATITFSPTTRNTAGIVTATVSNIASTTAGSYDLLLKGTASTGSASVPVNLKIFNNTIENVALSSPSNGATNQQTSVNLQWGELATASSYLVEISTSPLFTTITESATVTTNSYQTTALTQGTVNYWRVKPINNCTSGTYSEVFIFQVAADVTKSYSDVYFENDDSSWNIDSNNAVSARINVPDDIQISDVNFYMKATHSLLSDLKIQFSGPTGIFTEIYNRDCSGANIDVTFDDSGSALTPCTGTLSGTKQSSQPLSKFNNSSSLGTWVLLATDRVSNSNGGTFGQLRIDITGKLQYVNDISTTVNSALSVTRSSVTTLSQSLLKYSQPAATTAQLKFVLTKLPKSGTLKKSGVSLKSGDSFTQADINNNLLSYTNDGILSTSDTFTFAVTGNNNAISGGQVFNINISCNTAASLNSVSPSTVTKNSGDFTLTATGSNFVNGESIIYWKGIAKPTTFVSSTQLTALISNNDISTEGTANVTIYSSCNGTTSSAKTVTISGTLSTVNQTPNEFLVYPLPFENLINIQIPTLYSNEIFSISIFDLNGKLKYSQKSELNTNITQLQNLGTLSSGAYILQIIDSNKKVVLRKRLIKN